MTDQPAQTDQPADIDVPEIDAYVGPTEAVAIAAGNAGVSLSDDEARRLADALTDMGAVFDDHSPSADDAVVEDPRVVAAEVLDRFASPGADTPGFTALLEEFPDLSSRGNLKIILWRVAGALREHPLP